MKTNGSAPRSQPRVSKDYLAAREAWLKQSLSIRGLPQRGKVVASALFLYFNQEGFIQHGRLEGWPSLRTLDNATGLDRKTVEKGIKDLEACGALTVVRRYNPETRRHTSNLYTALMPNDQISPTRSEKRPKFPYPRGDRSPTLGETGGPDSMKDSMSESISIAPVANAPVAEGKRESEKGPRVLPPYRKSTSLGEAIKQAEGLIGGGAPSQE